MWQRPGGRSIPTKSRVPLENRADRDCKPARSACAVAARDRDTIGHDDKPGQSYPPAAAMMGLLAQPSQRWSLGQNNQKCDPGAHLAVIMQRFDGYAVLDGGFA